MINPALTLGEIYMDGRLIVTKGDLYDVLELGARNLAELAGSAVAQGAASKLASRSAACTSATIGGARGSNIARHYDLDARLYDLFLDSDLQYSCAYFEHPGQSLDDAQTAKKRHIAAKLLSKDGATVLDIGCGFGGMALYLAGVAGAKVTGVTLSEEQFGVATSRARDSGIRPNGSSSACRTIATSRRPSTASSRSACSSMSAWIVTTNFSPPSAVCSRTTG